MQCAEAFHQINTGLARTIEATLSMTPKQFQKDIDLLCSELKSIKNKKQPRSEETREDLARTYRTIQNLLKRSKRMLMTERSNEKARNLLNELDKLVSQCKDPSNHFELQDKVQNTICESIIRSCFNDKSIGAQKHLKQFLIKMVPGNSEDEVYETKSLSTWLQRPVTQSTMDRRVLIMLAMTPLDNESIYYRDFQRDPLFTYCKHIVDAVPNNPEVWRYYVKAIVRMLRDEQGLSESHKKDLQNLLIKIQNDLWRTQNEETAKDIIKLAAHFTTGIMTNSPSNFYKVPLEIRAFINEFNADEPHSFLQMRNFTANNQ